MRMGARAERWAPAWLALLLGAFGAAAAEAADAPELKLTVGRYALGGAAGTGTDVNLRWRQGPRTLWLGVYEDASFGHQLRGGSSRVARTSAAPTGRARAAASKRGWPGGRSWLVTMNTVPHARGASIVSARSRPRPSGRSCATPPTVRPDPRGPKVPRADRPLGPPSRQAQEVLAWR